MDLGQDALRFLQVGLPAVVEAHAAMPAVEQRYVDVPLEHADAVGDGGRADAELLGGAGEALEAGRGLEEAQAMRWPRRSPDQILDRLAVRIHQLVVPPFEGPALVARRVYPAPCPDAAGKAAVDARRRADVAQRR